MQDRRSVAGVDGCRDGWLVVRAGRGSGPGPLPVRTVEVVPRLDDLLDDVRRGRVAAVAVDMPIGLPADGPRVCDVEARALLGPRRSSVFPTPVRPVRDAVDFDDALRRSRAASGRGLSLQSWHLLPRIAELDDSLVALPRAARRRVHETHPELAFSVLGGAPMRHHKRTARGRRERLGVLRGHVPERWRRRGAAPTGAADDDLLDALVLAVRAAQWLDGTPPPLVLGEGDTDGRGHPCSIRG